MRLDFCRSGCALLMFAGASAPACPYPPPTQPAPAMLNWALRETVSNMVFKVPAPTGAAFYGLSWSLLAVVYGVGIYVPNVWFAMSLTGGCRLGAGFAWPCLVFSLRDLVASLLLCITSPCRLNGCCVCGVYPPWRAGAGVGRLQVAQRPGLGVCYPGIHHGRCGTGEYPLPVLAPLDLSLTLSFMAQQFTNEIIASKNAAKSSNNVLV